MEGLTSLSLIKESTKTGTLGQPSLRETLYTREGNKEYRVKGWRWVWVEQHVQKPLNKTESHGKGVLREGQCGHKVVNRQVRRESEAQGERGCSALIELLEMKGAVNIKFTLGFEDLA